MNVYVGWSGDDGREMAEILRRWLQSFFRGRIDFFISPESIPPGRFWVTEFQRILKDLGYGLLCVTRDSVQSPSLHFEAGMMSSQSIPVGTVLSFGVSPSELPGPLRQFQSFSSDREGIRRLVCELNSYPATSMPVDTLNSMFSAMYPALQRDFNKLWEKQEAMEKQRRKDRGGQEDSLASVNQKLDAVLSALASMSETPAKRTGADSQAHMNPASGL